MKTIVFTFAVLVLSVQCVKIPSNFKKCNRKDPEVDKCVLEAAQDGVKQVIKEYPKIALASLAPLIVTELKIGAGSQGVVNVDQNFYNCKAYGIDGIHFDDFGFDFVDKRLHIRGVIPEIKKLCDYDLNGRILLLPIIGTGPSTIILKNVNVSLNLDFEEVKRNGKTYIEFKTQKLSLDPENISFNFENLFNGDKALGDNINKVLNENDKEVFADVRKGYEEGIGLILMQLLQNLFKKVSIEDAFD